MRTAWIGVLGAVMACNGDDGGSDATDDTGADTTTSPTSETTSPPTPTPTGPVGLLLRTGTLVWDGSAAAGTESLTLLGDSGYGAARCTLTYQLQSTEARADCEGCDWAFDLAIAGASVALDDGSCLATTGYDATTVSALDGTIVSMGYNPDYVGHAEVLMSPVDGMWQAVSYVSYDPATGTLDYEWEDGFVSY